MAIDPNFQKIVKNLMQQQDKVGTASVGDQKRPWLNFEDLLEAGKFEFEKVHKIFTRESSTSNYTQLRANPEAKGKELHTAKLSHDFLAQCERDYRMRTRSRVRTLVHAGATLPKSNGSKAGALQRNAIDWLGRILTEESQ